MNLQKSFLLILITAVFHINAQISPGIYHSNQDNVSYELKLDNAYFILSVYEKSPAKFIRTLGGFYTLSGETLSVNLEFDSNFKEDGAKTLEIPYKLKGQDLLLKFEGELRFTKSKNPKQDLDGAWLFATRGPDTGQERRGDENPRKTLKFLLDGRFQWIAYNIKSMEFFGTGGGAFTSKGGTYLENIEYFSRDNSRTGASLKFDYELKGKDWHHKGLNSKGEPMYEIWSRR
ncbi:MAG: hypothetical protein AAFX53_19255 [Bacteroidota bacterium]